MDGMKGKKENTMFLVQAKRKEGKKKCKESKSCLFGGKQRMRVSRCEDEEAIV